MPTHSFQLRKIHEDWIREHIDEYRYDVEENHGVILTGEAVNLFALAKELDANFEGLTWRDGGLMYEVYRFCEALPSPQGIGLP